MPSPLNKTIRLTKKEQMLPVEALPKKILSKNTGIYCDDVINALKTLPKNYFNLVIADPPYNSGRDFGNDSDRQGESEYRNWVYEWVSLLPRVLSTDASVYIC